MSIFNEQCLGVKISDRYKWSELLFFQQELLSISNTYKLQLQTQLQPNSDKRTGLAKSPLNNINNFSQIIPHKNPKTPIVSYFP
jgi:hypothetical protein